MNTLSEQKKFQLVQNAGMSEHYVADNWADYNRKFFNGLAPKYDALNQVLTFGLQGRYKKQAVQRSGVHAGDLVLDVCTGTGDIAFLIADLFENSYVIGLDAAEKMIELAEKRGVGRGDVEFRLGDAQNLPFKEQMFDSVFMSYGLRNLTDHIQGIKELIRVVKPGGAVNVIDLGKPKGRLKTLVYKTYFENILPFLGRHIFHRGECNSFRYLPESNKHFPPPEVLKFQLIDCGLKDVEIHTYMGGAVVHFKGYA